MRLMSFCVRAMVAAKIAVTPPVTATTSRAAGERLKSGARRATMKTPAVTIVAAWIKAEMGVGPSIASGSQTCSGTWADLPTAPAKRRRQITVMTSTGHSPPIGLRRLIVCPLSSTAWAKTWSYCREPNTAKISMTPKPNPKSPTRFTMNAFVAASQALLRSYQCPISR